MDLMPQDQLVVVGASAGGIGALEELLHNIAADFRAAMLVVLHISPWSQSKLPEVLGRSTTLPIAFATHDSAVQPGHIYLAPPDHHLLIEEGRLQLWRGPKENFHRPAINPLFRAAAMNYGKRATGVVLSGAQDDGSTGLWWIKRAGGVAIVQDPEQAPFPDMPTAALRFVDVDYVARASDIGRLLSGLSSNGRQHLPKKDVTEWKRAKI
jgi:two-component system chemotaxis response regulator CheB